MFYGTNSQYYPGAQTPPLTETINQVSTPSFGGTATGQQTPNVYTGGSSTFNEMSPTNGSFGGSAVQTPQTNLNDPGGYMRSLDWSNPQNASGQLLNQMLKNQWSLDQVGQPFGFSGDQMREHFAKYVTVPDAAIKGATTVSNSGTRPNIYVDPNTGLSWQANYRPVGNAEGGDNALSMDLENWNLYDPNNTKAGDLYSIFDPSGKFSGVGQMKDDDWQQMLAMFLAAAGGLAMLPGGAFSGTFGLGTMAAQNGLESVVGGAGAGAGGTVASGAVTSPVASGAIPAGTALGPAATTAAGTAAGAGTSFGGSTLANTVAKTAAGTVLNSVLNGGGGTSNGGINLNNLAGLISSIYGAGQQKDSAKDMINWLNGQQAKIDNLYAPGSPEYNYLWQEMSRKDAAAGRNSQYGPRSVDLAARIAGIKADNTARLTTGIGNTYAAALRDRANSTAGIPAILGSMLGGNGAGNISVSGLLNSIFGSSLITDSLTNDMPEGLDMDPVQWWLQYGTGGD